MLEKDLLTGGRLSAIRFPPTRFIWKPILVDGGTADFMTNARSTARLEVTKFYLPDPSMPKRKKESSCALT
ncbi:hypothetical protein ACLOJK_010763 [Asimina triloba]